MIETERSENVEKAQKYQIYFLLVFVMAAWGLNVTATKILVTTFMPVTITAFRIFTAGISVFIILFFLKQVRIPTKQEFIYIMFGGIFNVVGHHYFLSMGLTKTSASNGGLILGLGPLLTTILTILFLKSTVTLIRILGIFFGLIGVSFIVIEGNGGISDISLGDVYVFFAILSQAISFIIIKKVSKTLDPRLMTGYMLLIGSIFLFFISLFKEPNGVKELNGSIGIWMIFFASAIIATALGHMIYNYALGKVGVVESSIFINLSPFFSLIGAVLFLDETISLPQILGFIFILAGVLFGSGALEEWINSYKQKRKLPYTEKVKRSV